MASTYKIQSGDTLSGIVAMLAKQGITTTVDDLAALNGIKNVGVIRAGATIRLPDANPDTSAADASATNTSSTATTTRTTAELLADAEANRPEYQQSDALTLALQQLADYQNNRPADYTSQYSAQIESILAQLLGRDKFSYDLGSDAVYQQYLNQYTQQGKQAMMDTMGQASQLTGGYGNSYAQSAGQQAYNASLAQLGDIIPDLRNAAYRQYAAEGDQLATNAAMLEQADQLDYNKYRDTVSDYNTELQYLTDRTDQMSDDEYQQYLDELAKWGDNRDYLYQKSQDEQDQANWQAQFDLANASRSSGGSGGDGGDDGDDGDDEEVGSSEQYQTALNGALHKARLVAQGSTGVDPYAYIAYMVNHGYITEAEGDAIYAQVRAVIGSSSSSSSSSSTSTGSQADAFRLFRDYYSQTPQ